MALKGTLADLRIVDLIQFPHAGKKSGQLAIKKDGQEAKLYYERGALVHVTLDDASGMDALVRVVDWTEGAFEFDADVQADSKTIELDLHRAIMQALKLHDELKAEGERRKGEKVTVAAESDEALTAQLADFVNNTDYALNASVLSADGTIKASADSREGRPQGIDELLTSLNQLVQSHGRAKINRVILDDDLGTVVLVGLSSGGYVIVVASGGASLGAVTIGVGRLAARLE